MKKCNSICRSLCGVFVFLFLASPAFALRFNFIYDQAYSWSPEAKAQIEEAGKFLAAFITDNNTVDINVTVNSSLDENTWAIGAPNEWAVDTKAKTITKKGSIAYNPAALNSLDQSSIVALSIHELLHTLGFTSGSQAFMDKIKNNYSFEGSNAKRLNKNKGVVLASDKSHFEGDEDPVQVVPRMDKWGRGELISILDLAVLADIGYTVPTVTNATAAKYLDLTLNELYHNGMSYGPWQRILVGMGGNDVMYGPDKPSILTGLGGNDVLVTGNAKTQLWGDQGGGNSMGIDGSDIYYIKSNFEHEIYGLESHDKVYLSPGLGITAAQLSTAQIQDAGMYMMMGGKSYKKYTLTAGSFKLIIWNPDMPKKENISVRDWSK